MKWVPLAILLVMASAIAAAFALRDAAQFQEWMQFAKQEYADIRQAATLPYVPCPGDPIVIAGLGQSNAGNHIATHEGPDGKAAAYVYFRGGCVPIADPLPGSTGNDGSLWTVLAQRLSRERKRPVVMIAAGAGGASVTNWADETWPFGRRTARALTRASAMGLAPHVIVWMQGETDNNGRMTEAEYRTHLSRVIDRFSAAVAQSGPAGRPAWIILQETRCGPPATISEPVRAAQRAIADPARRIYAGPDADALGDSHRSDGCHFNAAGRDALSEQLIEMLRRLGPSAGDETNSALQND